MSSENAVLIDTPEAVRGFYLTVIDPRPYTDPKTKVKGEPKYSASLILEPGSPLLAKCEAIVRRLLLQKFPEDQLKFITNKPLVSGTKLAADKGEKFDFCKGKAILKIGAPGANALQIGAVVDGKIVNFTENRKAAAKYFYAGVKVIADLNFALYDGFGGGVTCYVNSIVSLNQGDKIEGVSSQGPSLEEKFSGYVGLATAEDPTRGQPSEW